MNPDFHLTTSLIITLVVSVILLLAIIYSFIPIVAAFLNERRLKKAVHKLGKGSLRQVVLPDGLGGNIYIDYLVMSANAIIMVILKRYRGTIFCAENMDQWTQLVGNRSFKFDNPLRQHENDMQALQSLIPAVSVKSMVLFHGACDFPKGKPDNVKTVSELLQGSLNNSAEQQPKLQTAWDQLKDMTSQHQSNDDLVKSYFQQKYDFQKWLLPAAFVLLLAGWLYLRLVLPG